jgi:predicted glutamine amidotransferase
VCEIVAVAAPQPRELGPLLERAGVVEHYGVAGFGWGIAWRGPDGVGIFKSERSIREDAEQVRRIGGVESDRYLIHLRRPSELSTIHLADTQPFVSERGGFAFCHNGSFLRHGEHRSAYADSLQGRADSEVGFRLFESMVVDDAKEGPEALATLHDRLSGNANLGFLSSDGTLAVYSHHEENAVVRFRWEECELASTTLHSTDDSIFDLVFSGATDRRTLDQGASVRVDQA